MTIGIIITIATLLVLAISGAILTSRFVKTNKTKRLILLIAAIAATVAHYSGIIYCAIGHAIYPDTIISAGDYLIKTPNLALPIYPCNTVLIACLILALIKNENSKGFEIFVDYVFLFGIVAALAGLVANGDYFCDTVEKDYLVYESIITHGILIYFILLLPLFGYFKLNALKNLINCSFSTIGMGIVGLFCSLVIFSLSGFDTMKFINPMFIFKSPIEALPIVRFYIVMPLFLVVLFIVLTILEFILLPKERRWYSRFKIFSKQ